MRKWHILVFFLLSSLTASQASTIDSLLQKLAAAKDDTAKVWLLNDLGKLYIAHNVDSSKLLLQQAVALSERLKFYKGQVASLQRLAAGLPYSSNTTEAIETYHRALKICKQHGIKEWAGRCYTGIGETFFIMNLMDSAIHYYNLAEKVNIAEGLEYNNWLALTSKAQIFGQLRQYDKAEAYYKAALQLTAQRKIRKDHGYVMFAMLNWYFSTEQWAAYSEISEQYLQLMAKGGNNAMKDAFHGPIYLINENMAHASKVKVLKTLIEQHTVSNSLNSLAATYMYLGDLLEDYGDVDGALAAYLQGNHWFFEVGAMDLSSHCARKASELYEAKKDYANAFLWYKKHQSIEDSLNTVSVQNNISELEIKYETGKMESEITQQQLKLEASSLARRNLGITVGALALAVLGALGFLYFKSKTNKELATKNSIISTALGEKELLLREIHHRVKNNLQVISSLLHLQSKYIEDEKAMEAMREGRNRVKSMALIHQDLYQNDNLTSVEVAPYLTKLTEGLFQSYNIDPDRIRLRSEVDAPRLDVDTLIPIGLILNELVSNALKHAFPGERPGEVAVSLKSLQNTLQLVVQDNGIGFAEHQKAKFEKSFGFEMVKTFAAKLKAKLEVENAEGTLVRLVIPQIA